ncbi:MAG: TIGR04255 family protein [Nitrospinae bacterium]|nr:TIGR04255 family protein [Nitrospinota bacterium]
MPEFEHFKNAPIREALIDIRATLPPEIDLSVLEKFQDEIKARFPERKKRVFWENRLEFHGENPPQVTPKGGPDGYLFKSPNEQKVVQARRDGFTFNKLKPYDHWDIFRNEAKELWDRYLKIAKPTKITRIVLRYINCIEIPIVKPEVALEDYVLIYPEIPKDFPYKLANFLTVMEVLDIENEITARINISMEPIKSEGKTLPLIFDIDAYRMLDLDPNDQKIWEIFETLRTFKNKIFFGSMTEKSKELFR